MARMPPAITVAPAIRIVGTWERINPIALLVETRNSWLRCHSRIRVAEPMTTTASGSAISRTHKPTCGRAAYQSTMRCAVCAGSYCNGWTLRANSADIKRTAGKTNSSSKAATERRIVFMGLTLYHKVNHRHKPESRFAWTTGTRPTPLSTLHQFLQ